MSDLTDLLEFKPYTYKRKWYLPFYGGLYDVIFDETVIFQHLNIIDAKKITAALNGAYYLGATSAK